MSADTRPAPSHRRPGRSRRPLLFTAIALIAWFVLGSVLGPVSGKLSEVQKNDNASFLPASAESTRVNELVTKFNDTTTFPALVLTTGDGTLPADAVAQVNAFAQTIPDLKIVEEGGADSGRTVADYLVPGAPLTAIPSQDGEAVLLDVSLDGDKIADPLPDGKPALKPLVDSIDAAAAKALPGYQVYVTGPAGILADLFSVFGALDVQLLLVTGIVVAIILVLVYRSPFLWLIPLLSAGFALTAAQGIVYYLAKNDVLTLNGQSQGILLVLVFGAGTDYALLVMSRYREELHHFESHVDAVKAAWKGTWEPLVASAATVSVGLLCLLFSELNSNKSTGPVAAVGIACALAAMLTFLPALLVLPSLVLPLAGAVSGVLLAFAVRFLLGLGGVDLPGAAIGVSALVGAVVVTAVMWRFVRATPGRWVFWPKVPGHDDVDERLSGVWSKVAGAVGRRPVGFALVSTVVLLALVSFVPTLKADGLSQTDAFTNRPESVKGQDKLAAHFPGGAGSPAIIIAKADQADAVAAAAKSTPGVAAVVPFTGRAPGQGSQGGAAAQPKVVDGLVQLQATLSAPIDSLAAEDTVKALRQNVSKVDGAQALVGGYTAVNLDTQEASRRDRDVIIPIVLAVILVILGLLLRSVVAPVVLIITVVLSFFATLGACAVMFNHVFHFAGADTSFPLFAFTFLVALGVDYNIFLMTRVREESAREGTKPGTLKALTVTGGVITSAGVILAATFAVLGVLPLVFLAELGFAVAFGVLLDTLVVRSLLVPSLVLLIGKRVWWPSRLARAEEAPPLPPAGERREQVPVG
ncbi:MAG: MMPL family transporter [Motilibacteraceae bacterium]